MIKELSIDTWITEFHDHLILESCKEYLKFIEDHADDTLDRNYEKHHIIPKSLYRGSPTVKLSYRDHYLAHELLTKCFISPSKERRCMSYALHMMASRKCGSFSAEAYEYAKSCISSEISGDKNPMYGRRWTDEMKQRAGNSRRGPLNPNYGKHLTDSTKKQLSAAKSRTNIGRVWINNGVSNKFIQAHLLQEYINNGWVKGRLSPSDETRNRMRNSALKRYSSSTTIESRTTNKSET